MLTADQLAAALTDETFVDMAWSIRVESEQDAREVADMIREIVVQALQPALTGTCQTCRHWQTRVVQTYEGMACALDCYGPNQPEGYACNRWQRRETHEENR
jgi:hypothetical protein